MNTQSRHGFRDVLSALAMGVVCMIFLAGCAKPVTPDDSPGVRVPRDEPPPYAEAVRRYNENAKKVDRLWSRAVTTLEWFDSKGERRIEQGDDCFVVYVAPDRFALSIGKLGKTLMWVGCDEQRYWMFDLQEPRSAYVGTRANAGKPCVRPLPMVGGVSPRDVMRLMGVEPIDADAEPAGQPVEWHEGQWLIEPPGTGTRLLIDPETGLATRIDLLDEHGYSRLICRLSHTTVIESFVIPPGGPAKIASRLNIELPDGSGSVRLTMSSPTDGRRDDRIQDRVFDFDRLRKLLKVEEDATHSLDADCE